MYTQAKKTSINSRKSSLSRGGTTMRKGDVNSVLQLRNKLQNEVTQKRVNAIANIILQVDQATQLKDSQMKTNTASNRRSNNTGLPDKLKSGIEHLSGYSMGDVNVYYNSDKPAQLHAHAYAQGTDIHLGPRQEKHLPHEAWHVVQQKQGRVKPTKKMKGNVKINDNDGLEKEADLMGRKALQTYSNQTNVSVDLVHQFFNYRNVSNLQYQHEVLQRYGLDEELVIKAKLLLTELGDIEELGFYEMDLNLNDAYIKYTNEIKTAIVKLGEALKGDSDEKLHARITTAEALMAKLKPKLLISDTFTREREMVSKLIGLGFFDDPELEEAIIEVASRDEHQTMKKLLGEYLGRDKTSDQLKSDEVTFDKVFTSVFLIELIKRKIDSDGNLDPIKDNDREGPVVGDDNIKAWQRGEFDTLFCRREGNKFVPIVLLESKGGNLSTQAVQKQTRQELDRLVSVSKNPENLALATRPHPKKGPFTIITDLFNLNTDALKSMKVYSSGPTRKGEGQYDIDLGLTSKELEHLGRFLALYRIEYMN